MPVFLALLLALASAGLLVGVQPAFADSTLCTGNAYSTCTGAGYTDHGYGANNGNMYWSMYSGHNCTNYAAYVEQTVNGAATPGPNNLGNAYEWDNNASADGITVDTTPKPGSVAQWEANYHGADSSGHVAYVESVSSDGSTITISEDNFSSGPFQWKTITTSGNWPSHFIHFKDLVHQGTSTLGEFNSSNSTFYLRNSNSAGNADITVQYGNTGWTPIVGDWDGNGTTTLGEYDPSTSTFYLRNSNSAGNADITVQYGNSGWIPVVGDWDSNGTTTIGVYTLPRPRSICAIATPPVARISPCSTATRAGRRSSVTGTATGPPPSASSTAPTPRFTCATATLLATRISPFSTATRAGRRSSVTGTATGPPPSASSTAPQLHVFPAQQQLCWQRGYHRSVLRQHGLDADRR